MAPFRDIRSCNHHRAGGQRRVDSADEEAIHNFIAFQKAIKNAMVHRMTRKCRTRCEEMLSMTAESFPEIDTPGMRLIARLFRIRDLIYENAQREMTRFGLSPVEYSVMATLRKRPFPHELRPSDIYKGMLLSSGGLTKVLKGLEQRALIERQDDEVDRRGCRVRLTPAGIDLAGRAMQSVIESDIALLRKAASPEHLEALAEALKPFTETLDR